MKKRKRGAIWPFILFGCCAALLAGTGLYLSVSGDVLFPDRAAPAAKLTSLAASPAPGSPTPVPSVSSSTAVSSASPSPSPATLPSPSPSASLPSPASSASAATGIAEQPTASGPLDGLVIGLDPGHQKNANSGQEPLAPGAKETKDKVSAGATGISSGQKEYTLNLSVALKLEQLLLNSGATVVMTRKTDDVDISNAQRAQLMNDEKVNLCLRIHANGSDNPAVSGVFMYVPGGQYTSGIAESSRRAAETILQSFVNETGAKNDGIVRTDDLTGFNYSRVPVCLIEMGFLSNPDEDRLMATAAYQDKCAQGLYKGIVEWYTKAQYN